MPTLDGTDLRRPSAATPLVPAPAASGMPWLAAPVLALVCALALVVVPIDVPPPLAVLVVAVFYLLVPGGLSCCMAGSSRSMTVALVPTVGVAVLMGQATLDLWTGHWAPVRWTMMTAGCALAVAGWLSWRERRVIARDWHRLVAVLGAARRWAPSPGRLAWLAAAVVLVLCWATSLPALRDAPVTSYGLMAAAPWRFPIAVVGSVLLFAAAVRAMVAGERQASGSGASATAGALGAVGLLWVFLRVTPTLITDVPIYPWTYKHLGVTDTISSLGTLLPDADIYYSWPAMFAGSAWFCDITGLDPVQLAHWTTPLVHVMLIGAVVALARATGLRRPAAIVAAFLAEAVSWVGQDYFAPQAIAMVLAVVVLALVMSARPRSAELLLSLGMLAVLVPTHQLTPFWVLGVVGVLAFMGRAPGWLFWAMAAVALGYAALQWDIIDSYGVVSSASPLDNAQTNTVVVQSDERALGQTVFRMTAVAMWLPAAAVWAVEVLRRRGRTVVRGTLAFSPFALLAAQNYGGEAILRVFLYSVPGVAVLLAPVVVASLSVGLGRTRRSRPAAWASWTAGSLLVVGCTSLATQSYFTAWFTHRVSAAEAAVAERLLEDVPGAAYLSAAGDGWPTRSSSEYVWRSTLMWDYDRSILAVLDEGVDLTKASGVAALESVLEEQPVPTYLLFADNVYASARYDNAEREASMHALHEHVADSRRWEPILSLDDVEVYRYVPADAANLPASTWVP